MSINSFSTRLLTLTAALAAGGALAACGDDSTPKGSVDARRADAMVSNPDAPMFDAAPTATVSSTIAITDVALVDPSSLAAPPNGAGGIGGGSILMSFSDLTDAGGGTVVAGTTNVNGCIVVKYDPTHPPHALLDAGPISITNSPANENPATGLLKTVGPCTNIPALGGYTCISHATNGTPETVTASTAGVPAGTVAYVFTTPFTGQNLIGSYLSINGFTTTTAFNSGASAFPILNMPNANTLLVLNAAGNASGATDAAVSVEDTILNGFNPVPDQGPGDNGPANFLGTGSIEIKKDANSVWPAIDQTVDVPGEGWTLSDPGDPTAFPLTTAPTNGLTFGCGNSGGTATCGDSSTNLIQAMIVSGRATKKSLAGLAPFQMPTDVPGTDTWEEFQCAFIGAQDATLSKDAIQAIIDFQPTRVETRVINAAGAIIMTGPGNLNTLNLLVGHGYVGHTDPP